MLFGGRRHGSRESPHWREEVVEVDTEEMREERVLQWSGEHR